jgi:tetratricopeptide (TPR) repeat protein
MTLRSKLVVLIERMSAEEQALFANLSEAERATRGEPDRWSPKDVIGHLAAWKERAVGNLEAAARGESPVRYDDYEAVNARDFEVYRDKSWAEILEKALTANRQLIEQIEGRSEAELEAVLHEERTVWQSIAGTGYAHPVTHLGQIYVDRGDSGYGTKLAEGAAEALLQLDRSPGWEGTVRYNLACHYALMGEAERAISGLREALELNPGLTDWSKEDPDFASIREEPGYLALYEK